MKLDEDCGCGVFNCICGLDIERIELGNIVTVKASHGTRIQCKIYG